VGDNLQQEGSALAVIRAGAGGFPQSPLDHTEHGFDLPSLAVLFLVQPKAHQPAMIAHWRRSRFPSVLGRDDRPRAENEANEDVNPLRVVAGVGKERRDADAAGGLSEYRIEVAKVGLGAAFRMSR